LQHGYPFVCIGYYNVSTVEIYPRPWIVFIADVKKDDKAEMTAAIER